MNFLWEFVNRLFSVFLFEVQIYDADKMLIVEKCWLLKNVDHTIIVTILITQMATFKRLKMKFNFYTLMKWWTKLMRRKKFILDQSIISIVDFNGFKKFTQLQFHKEQQNKKLIFLKFKMIIKQNKFKNWSYKWTQVHLKIKNNLILKRNTLKRLMKQINCVLKCP